MHWIIKNRPTYSVFRSFPPALDRTWLHCLHLHRSDACANGARDRALCVTCRPLSIQLFRHVCVFARRGRARCHQWRTQSAHKRGHYDSVSTVCQSGWQTEATVCSAVSRTDSRCVNYSYIKMIAVCMSWQWTNNKIFVCFDNNNYGHQQVLTPAVASSVFQTYVETMSAVTCTVYFQSCDKWPVPRMVEASSPTMTMHLLMVLMCQTSPLVAPPVPPLPAAPLVLPTWTELTWTQANRSNLETCSDLWKSLIFAFKWSGTCVYIHVHDLSH